MPTLFRREEPTFKAIAMKWIRAVLMALLVLAFINVSSLSAKQNSYYLLGRIGGYGDNEALNLSVDVGAYNLIPKSRNTSDFLVGIGIAFSATDEALSSAIDTYIPHTNFRLTDYRNKGPEFEGYLRAGISLFEGGYLGPVIGYAIQERIRYAHSNVTGWYWEMGTTRDGWLTYGVSLVLTLEKGILVSMDVTNRRGVGVGVGITSEYFSN